MTQLSLFGDPQHRGSLADELEPLRAPDPGVVRLAQSVPPLVRFGTCSWTFPGWDVVYRRHYPSDKVFRREALAEYATFGLFRAVEVDSTYYAPPTVATLDAMSQRIHDDLECAFKVWSELTTFVFPRHARFGDRAGMKNERFLDPASFAEHVIAPYAESGFTPLGPLIVEIPPIPRGAIDARELERRLSRFLAQAPEGYRYAIEVRDPTLLTDRHFALLRDHGAAHVYTFHSRMPTLGDQLDAVSLGAAPFAVTRLMLPPGTRYADQKERFEPFDRIREPQREMRADVVRMAREAVAANIPLYVFCNNKAEGSSPLTAMALAELIANDVS